MMKLFAPIIFGILISICALPSYADSPPIEVTFSPKQGSTKAIVELIKEAKKSIRVAAYSFTSRDIAAALVSAHKKGIDVKAVLDKSNLSAKYTAATFLANARIPTRINSNYAIMHNKYLIIDQVSIQTGSFNYTNAAENKNAENVIILRDQPKLARLYSENWQILWDESEDYLAAY